MERLRSLGNRIARAFGKGDAEAPGGALERKAESPYRAGARESAEPPRVVYEANQWIASICADDSGLYVVDAGRLLRADGDGGTPHVIASLGAWPVSLALDEANIYWAERSRPLGKLGDEGPWRVVKLGGAPVRVATEDRSVREGGARMTEITAIAARDGVLHWIEREYEDVDDEGKPYRRTLGCRVLRESGDEAVELTCRPRAIERFFIDEEAFHWAERGVSWESWLMSMPRSGGAASTLRKLHERAPRRGAVHAALAFDGERFYWSDGQTEHLCTARARGDVTRIPCASFPLAIAAEGRHVVAMLGKITRREREIVQVLPGSGRTVTLARFEVAEQALIAGRYDGLLALGGGSAYYGSRHRIWRIDSGVMA